jgi:hypothetical protein
MPRGTLTIYFNVTDAQGRKFTRTYDWADDVDALLHFIEETHRQKTHHDVTPHQLAAEAISRFPQFGLLPDERQRQGMINYAVWFVLTQSADVGTVADKIRAGDHVEAELQASWLDAKIAISVTLKGSGVHTTH